MYNMWVAYLGAWPPSNSTKITYTLYMVLIRCSKWHNDLTLIPNIPKMKWPPKKTSFLQPNPSRNIIFTIFEVYGGKRLGSNSFMDNRISSTLSNLCRVPQPSQKSLNLKSIVSIIFSNPKKEQEGLIWTRRNPLRTHSKLPK